MKKSIPGGISSTMATRPESLPYVPPRRATAAEIREDERRRIVELLRNCGYAHGMYAADLIEKEAQDVA